MDLVIELELIDLATVEPLEPVAYPLKQRAQLRLVVRGDKLSGSTAPGLIARWHSRSPIPRPHAPRYVEYVEASMSHLLRPCTGD